jgi:hypothetical protein
LRKIVFPFACNPYVLRLSRFTENCCFHSIHISLFYSFVFSSSAERKRRYL